MIRSQYGRDPLVCVALVLRDQPLKQFGRESRVFLLDGVCVVETFVLAYLLQYTFFRFVRQ